MVVTCQNLRARHFTVHIAFIASVGAAFVPTGATSVDKASSQTYEIFSFALTPFSNVMPCAMAEIPTFIKYVEQHNRLSHLDSEELKTLQLHADVIFQKYPPLDLDLIWNRLTPEQQQRFASFRRCTRHWNQSGHRDHIDGPVPLIRNCHFCQEALS